MALEMPKLRLVPLTKMPRFSRPTNASIAIPTAAAFGEVLSRTGAYKPTLPMLDDCSGSPRIPDAHRIAADDKTSQWWHDYLDTMLDFGVDQLLKVYAESETGTLPVRRSGPAV
jgi:hypothetical protein